MSSSNIAASLLSRAHSPSTTNRILTEKIRSRPLLLKPSEPSDLNARQQRRQQRAQQASRRKKLKPRPLTARQKRALCIHEIPAAERAYALYEPLHRLWAGYVREVLGVGAGANCAPLDPGSAARLASADFHGAELAVVRSRCVSRVGVRGIVVRDSKFCFVVVTRADEVKVLPKEHTVFRFEVPRPAAEDAGVGGGGGGDGVGEEAGRARARGNLVFELHGDQFRYRAADRANKKFKTHFLPNL